MKLVSKRFNLRNFYFENLGKINSSLVKIINIVVNFFLYFFLLRKLGLSNAGLIYACLNLNILIVVIGQVGFKFSIIKYISQFFIQDKFNEIKKLIIFSTKIQGWLSFFITLILIIGISQLNQLLFSEIDFKNELALFILSIPFLLIKDNNAFIIQGLGAPVLALVINILLLPFFLILGVLVFPIQNTFDFSLIYLLSSLLNFVFSQKIREYIWSKNYKDKLIKNYDDNFFDKKLFLNFSFNAWKISLLSVFITRITELLVGIFSSPVDVSIFSTSLRISLLLNIPMIGTNQFIGRLIASSFKINDFNNIKNLFDKSLKFINMISLPIFIFIFLFPEFILNIFSSELTNSGNILRILAISSLVKIIFGPNEIILSMCGFEKYIFKSLLISFLISISFCIYLLPKFGLLGACFSLNIGNLLNSILLRLKFNNFIKLYNG